MSHSLLCNKIFMKIKKVKIFFLTITICVFFGAVKNSQAAGHYIREGAAGLNNGENWADAWNQLPTNLVRGDTYYVAGGSYGALILDTPNFGTEWIYIKKATTLAHGTEIGWEVAYGTSQASFTKITFGSSYWEVDGVTGGGPGAWTTGYGFQLYNGASVEPLISVTGGVVSNIVVKHCDIHDYPTDVDLATIPDGGTNYTHLISSGYGAGTNRMVNATFAYNWLHDVFGCMIQMVASSDAWTIEYNFFSRNKSTPSWHSEGIIGNNSNGAVIRHNWFDQIQGTGHLVVNNGPSNSWEVYGNVFTNRQLGNGAGNSALWIAITNPSGSADGWKIYNNTVAFGQGNNNQMQGNAVTNFDIKNNYAYGAGDGTETIWQLTGWAGSYNTYDSIILQHAFYDGTGIGSTDYPPKGDLLWHECVGFYAVCRNYTNNPFVNFLNGNLYLTTSASEVSPAGATLSSPYNVDMNGSVRGGDGKWDRGAIEYVGNDIVAPAAPSGLSVN